MTKYLVRITKAVEVEVEAENKDQAIQIARDQEGDGYLEFSMEVVVVPAAFGGRTVCQWLRALENECNASVYEAENGNFGFSG